MPDTYVPMWLLGRHVTSVSVTLKQMNASTHALETVPGSSAISLTGTLEEISLRVNAQHKDVTPTDVLYTNNVQIRREFRLVLRELMRGGVAGESAAPTHNILAYCASQALSPYFSFTFTRGNKSWTTNAIFSSYDEELRRSNCTSVLEVICCGENLTYADVA